MTALLVALAAAGCASLAAALRRRQPIRVRTRP